MELLLCNVWYAAQENRCWKPQKAVVKVQTTKLKNLWCTIVFKFNLSVIKLYDNFYGNWNNRKSYNGTKNSKNGYFTDVKIGVGKKHTLVEVVWKVKGKKMWFKGLKRFV